MKQGLLAIVVAGCLMTRSARADITFEPEPAAPATATPGPAQPPQPTPPPPKVPPPALFAGWTTPEIDFRLVTRALFDTAWDWPGENVAEWYNFLTASVRTSYGHLTLQLAARIRWVSYEEKPSQGTFNLFNGANPHSDFNPWPGESFADYRRWGIDFMAGMLDIAWGQNPVFSPADVLTPLDFRDGPLAGPDDRIPVPAVRIKGHLGPIDWDGVWLPIFIQSQLPLIGNDWSPYAAATNPIIPNLQPYFNSSIWGSLQSNIFATQMPAMNLSAPQGGIRLSAHPGPATIAVTWADFFDRQPVVTATPNFRSLVNAFVSQNQTAIDLAALNVGSDYAAGKAPLTAVYTRAMVAALDGSIQAGPVRFTLDTGYSPGRVLPLTDLTTTTQPLWSGVLGVEWEGPPVLAAGAYTVLVFDVPAQVRLLYLEQTTSDISRERDVFFGLGYLTIDERLIDDRLELALNSIVTFHGDLIATPSVHWHIRDAHTVGVGADIIAGPANDIGGEYAHNDEVFAEYILRL